MSKNSGDFIVGVVAGISLTMLVMSVLMVLTVTKTNDQWNRELVDRGIKQYDTKTGELKYVTPQDSI